MVDSNKNASVTEELAQQAVEVLKKSAEYNVQNKLLEALAKTKEGRNALATRKKEFPHLEKEIDNLTRINPNTVLDDTEKMLSLVGDALVASDDRQTQNELIHALSKTNNGLHVLMNKRDKSTDEHLKNTINTTIRMNIPATNISANHRSECAYSRERYIHD